MATYGHSWPNIAINGYIRQYMAGFGHEWPDLATYGKKNKSEKKSGKNMAKYGHTLLRFSIKYSKLRQYMAKYGNPMAIFGNKWPNTAMMAIFGHIMAQYGHKWPNMAIRWPYLAIYGRIWPVQKWTK